MQTCVVNSDFGGSEFGSNPVPKKFVIDSVILDDSVNDRTRAIVQCALLPCFRFLLMFIEDKEEPALRDRSERLAATTLFYSFCACTEDCTSGTHPFRFLLSASPRWRFKHPPAASRDASVSEIQSPHRHVRPAGRKAGVPRGRTRDYTSLK